MLASSTAAGEENKNKSLKLKGVSSSFSKSTSTSTSTSTSNSNLSPSRSTKIMEEVWKDINLASLNDQNSRPMTTSSTFGGIIFQDFLARPVSMDLANSTMVSSASEIASLYCPASPAPPPVTALSLSSRPDFHFDPLRPKGWQLVQPHHQHHHPASKVSCLSTPFDSLPCTSSLPCFGSKRFAGPADTTSPVDRRNKRMIKNRESAARSRARKQAYTNELQLKVDHLLEENARLKRQQQQLCEAAVSQQKKSSLYRTSTAPF